MGMPMDMRAMLAELLGTMLFVFMTSATTSGASMAAFQFAFVFAALMYSFGAYSNGGQFNPIFSIAMACCGKLSPVQAVLNLLMQICGGILGAMLICIVADKQAGVVPPYIGTILVQEPMYEAGNALAAEMIVCLLITYIYLATSDAANAAVIQPAATGMGIFAGAVFLMPVDGFGFNPARVFGPTLVATIGDRYNTVALDGSDLWENHWVYWLGPIGGALLAVGFNMLFTKVLAPKAGDAPATE